MRIVFLLFSFMFFLSTSCSVMMAAKQEGVEFEELQTCKTKTCFLSKNPEILERDTDQFGYYEIYKFKKKTGSAARAVMHGILDVATLGIWEVAGTPIEGAKNKDKWIVLKVYYDSDKETAKKVVIK